MEVVPKCEYCKNNEGENKKFGFMWHCKVLGHCVPFGYARKHSAKEQLQYCQALFTGKGSFQLDEVKYKESKLKKK